MQILTPEAAQAEILNKDFTSSETVLPLPSFDQSLQHLLQQAFWWWTIQSLPCPARSAGTLGGHNYLRGAVKSADAQSVTVSQTKNCP